MPDDKPLEGKDYVFNRVRNIGGPTEVTLQTGHVVTKEEYVYFQIPNVDASGPGDWTKIKCADYHGEHFVYLDPLYNAPAVHVDPNKALTGRGHYFAMCTCGSLAVIVGPSDAELQESDATESLLVCYIYHATLDMYGWGRHADQAGARRKW